MKNEIKNIVNVLKESFNTLLKFDHQYEFRKENGWKTYIGIIKEVNEGFNTIFIGHPLDVITGEMIAGEIGATFNDEWTGIKNIQKVTKEEYAAWLKEYKSFHKDIMLSEGYDICKEDLKQIIY